jgi:hypothetical protein
MGDHLQDAILEELRALRREMADMRTVLVVLTAQGERIERRMVELERRMVEMREDIGLTFDVARLRTAVEAAQKSMH